MKHKPLKSDLSVRGIQNLRKQLVHYKNNILQQKVDLLAKRLAEKGVAIAQTNIATYDAIFTGELIASIEARYGGSTKGTAVFYVVADSEHAAWVEFGTGQMGLESPYPYPFPEGVEWNYNTGKKNTESHRRYICQRLFRALHKGRRLFLGVYRRRWQTSHIEGYAIKTVYVRNCGTTYDGDC